MSKRPLYTFFENVFIKERVKLCFFVTFKIPKLYFFPLSIALSIAITDIDSDKGYQ